MSDYETKAKKNESYEPKAKTNQERAQSRYGGEFPKSNSPWDGPLLRDAEKNPKGQVADEVNIDAPPHQLTLSGDGNLKSKR